MGKNYAVDALSEKRLNLKQGCQKPRVPYASSKGFLDAFKLHVLWVYPGLRALGYLRAAKGDSYAPLI